MKLVHLTDDIIFNLPLALVVESTEELITLYTYMNLSGGQIKEAYPASAGADGPLISEDVNMMTKVSTIILQCVKEALNDVGVTKA
jgi:hypothetical protein